MYVIYHRLHFLEAYYYGYTILTIICSGEDEDELHDGDNGNTYHGI